MSFWTTQRIIAALKSENSPIIQPDLAHVINACYEMRLGAEAFVTSLGKTKKIYAEGTQLEIPPGQFALLITHEELCLPLNLLAFISIKASKKITGLINVSGFHVDPGFSGRLKYSVYNAGSQSIVLDIGKPLFPIWFFELVENNEDEYTGKHKGQKSISSFDVEHLQGDVASPAELKKRIDELSSSISQWKAATMGVIGGAIAIGIAGLVAIVRNWPAG